MPTLSFKQKAELFSLDYLKCCISLTDIDHKVFKKKLYLRLAATTGLLEDFLDFHGAKNNTTWYYYRELAAAVRLISLCGYAQRHIYIRLEFYDLKNLDDFQQEIKATSAFLKNTLINIAPAVLAEARSLNIPIPDDGFASQGFIGISTNTRLDYDIQDENKSQQKKNIVKIASEFLSIARNFEPLRFYEPYTVGEIKHIVPDKINEVEMRRFEMLFHNLQSAFDTYVIHGGIKFGNRKLKQLRSNFSIVFHLLQGIGRLLHFYERHLYETGYKSVYKEVQEKMSVLIDIEQLLDRIINYGLYYICHFIEDGKKVAKEVLNENIEKSSITVEIPVERGFHARPSLLVAKIVQHYGGKVELCIRDKFFDASSILDIQWAGGEIDKNNIKKVSFKGDTRALKDIKILASVNYGEDIMGRGVSLPKELNYLK
mmetsp:Transcript_23707/g.11414  ORF Transcript_23707/g.11414 Transcript_23707/m.11414 type:complete len:429 (-) Transcript_23707:78-1364(-)